MTTRSNRNETERKLRVERMEVNLRQRLGLAPDEPIQLERTLGELLHESSVNARRPPFMPSDVDERLAAVAAFLAARAGYVVLLPPEPSPHVNESPSVWSEVIADLDEVRRMSLPGVDVAMVSLVSLDMADRDRVGKERYGVSLQADNGRNALRDAYDEAMDLTVYRRQVYDEMLPPERRRTTQLLQDLEVAEGQEQPATIDRVVAARMYELALRVVLTTREQIARREDAQKRRGALP